VKPLLNTLFVTTQGAYLAREGLTVAVSVERETRARIPIHTLERIVCFGLVSCSPFLLQLASEHGVSISFCTEYGRFIARMQGPISGNVLLRRAQYRTTDDPAQTCAIARAIVLAKLSNCRTVVLRAARDISDEQAKTELTAASGRLRRIQTLLESAEDLDLIRGMEGDAASTYFSAFDHLIVVSKESFFFRGRSRRPPLDNLNALLSFLYTLLANDTSAALDSVGLDPQVGFLHRERPGRPSLALDLMEELRPVLADRLAATLINRRQITAAGFSTAASGGVTMDEATRKVVLAEWQLRKQDEILHPFLGERIAFGLVPYVQALLLARHLRKDLDGYPPFFWR
jgi:CRISPR-associated protein Cas1